MAPEVLAGGMKISWLENRVCSGALGWYGVSAAIALFLAIACSAAERINHDGRILGPLPVVTNSILFNTPEADAVIGAMQILPKDNAWNEDISRRPVLSNSDAMISHIIADLDPARRKPRAFYEMNFVLVPDSQPFVPIAFDNPPEFYPGDSDPGPYPFAANTPIETWPRGVSQTLAQWQRNDDGGDRHAIAVMPGSNVVWETWRTVYSDTGQTNWHAGSGARFDFKSNGLRPAGWTSADAAGLSMFAGLVRYDECQRGMVEHAVRLIVRRTRHEYIYPATHYASSIPAASNSVPAMGQRLRLKASFNIPANWSKEEKALLRGLKKYGAMVADNGNFFSVSVAPDQRFSASAFANFESISLTNFEVIQTTGATGGPRSPGAPTVDAGPDRNVPTGVPILLNASINHTGAAPLTLSWILYSGPTNATFAATNQTNVTVFLPVAGTYTLVFSASDGVHTPAYDALVVNAGDSVRTSLARSGTNVLLNWTGGTGPFRVERTSSLGGGPWSLFQTTNGTAVVIPTTSGTAFFRVVAQ